MDIEEYGEANETAMQVQKADSHCKHNPELATPSLSVSTSAVSPSSLSSSSSSSSKDNVCSSSSLHMVIPYTDPPRTQTIAQILPSIISFPKLSFLDPVQLKPIDLSTPLPVTSMTLDPDIASKIQAMCVDREMSACAPRSSKLKSIVPVHYQHQLWSSRKHVFSRLGVPCISDRQLLTAVRNADTSKVVSYLEDGADPNVCDCKRRTPLHVAASQGLDHIVSHLLSWRADPNRMDILGNTPLHLAVCRGDTRVVNILLRNGANINMKDGVGRTPLHIVQSRLGTLRRDRNISTDKLISECQMISEILRIHCSSQTYDGRQADLVAGEHILSSSTIDELCSMMKTISTREQADEIADTMIETMSQMHIQQTEDTMQRNYYHSIL